MDQSGHGPAHRIGASRHQPDTPDRVEIGEHGDMPKRSAGLLLHRRRADGVEVLLVHPGGPIWARKDDGAWSIPKGELDGEADALAVARREFAEELGTEAPEVAPVDLGEIRQRGSKIVRAFALEGDLDVTNVRSNTFEMEWPPRSGIRQDFPEVDRAGWFDLASARRKLNPAQVELLDRLEATCSSSG
jgi:predicted NUDIX family NTP pyrophosphohydrolase